MTITNKLRHLALVASSWLLVSAAHGASVTFSSKELCVEGVAAPLEVEVAQTQAQRNRGLMQRESLAKDAGMLISKGRTPAMISNHEDSSGVKNSRALTTRISPCLVP